MSLYLLVDMLLFRYMTNKFFFFFFFCFPSPSSGSAIVYVCKANRAAGFTALQSCVHSRRSMATTFDNMATRRLAIGNESVPIQLAQCWFRGLAISDATKRAALVL